MVALTKSGLFECSINEQMVDYKGKNFLADGKVCRQKTHATESKILKKCIINIEKFSEYRNNKTQMISLSLTHTRNTHTYICLITIFKSKFDTQAFNQKLNNIVQRFSHVSVVEMCSERRFYTRHGLHMNLQGKEMFAKRTASKIKQLLELPNKPKQIIPLPSKEDLLTLSQTLSTDITVKELPIVKEIAESPDLGNISSSKPTPVSSDTHLRSSTRNKKVPCTMTTDFLWYKQPILGHQ